jgi:CDP-glycerol glycerophosphotransferase (TagB/SpsB family)
MLALTKHRDEYRRKWGFKPDEIVVFVMAGYSEDDCNLYYTVGDAVLAEAKKLLGEFRFILNVHPHEYRTKPPGQRVWGEYLRTQRQHGFVVREPHESWIPCMVACDVILTDQTSLALHGALLERPVVYAPVPDYLLEKGALVWRLREISPKIKPDASDLRDRLLEAIHNYPIEALRQLAQDINSYPGQSAERVLKEVYGLLGLPVPKHGYCSSS